jgi:hypothetical protein
MKQRSLLFAGLALALSIPALASAQPQQFRHPPPRDDHDLVNATNALAQQAQAESPNGRFARVAQRLAQEAWQAHQSRDMSRFETIYVRARRTVAVSDGHQQPSDALLDAWDRVVAVYAPMRRGAQPPRPMPPRPMPPAQTTYRFEGRFEQTPVSLTGRSLEELEAACLQFTSAIDTRYVDDVTIGNQAVRNGPSYWDAPALCSIVSLNATTQLRIAPTVTGSIEGLPFSITGSREVVERALRTHLPRVVRGMQVDDVTINGRAYRNGPSYWSAEQITALIVSQLPAGPYAYGQPTQY